jgi:hypothetical protein
MFRVRFRARKVSLSEFVGKFVALVFSAIRVRTASGSDRIKRYT